MANEYDRPLPAQQDERSNRRVSEHANATERTDRDGASRSNHASANRASSRGTGAHTANRSGKHANQKKRRKKKRSMLPKILLALCMLLCVAVIIIVRLNKAPDKANGIVPSAQQLLNGVLLKTSLSAPDLTFSIGDDEFAEKLETLYNIEPAQLQDGAFAISSGMIADEIVLFLPADASQSAKITEQLRNHVAEEVSAYENYSPTDTANLNSARILTENGFIVLIVSADRDQIASAVREYLANPETLPELPEPIVHAAPELPPASDPEESSITEPPAIEETPEPTASLDHVYAYENELPERPFVGDEFFADAVFIGDSRMNGLVRYTETPCVAAYAYTSLTVSSVFTKELVETKKGNMTVADALKYKDFSKCYLMFGLNELGWPSAQTFIERYVKVIDLVRSVNPDADIYLMNIYPATQTYDENHPERGNKPIKKRNDMLAELAKQYDLKLVNAAAALCDENGYLPSDASSDGIHANRDTCYKLYNYLHAHY